MITKQKDLLILLFLFLLAFIIRLLLISKGPFHMDTLDLAINAVKSLDNLSIHYMHGAGYPLTVIVGSSTAIAGSGVAPAFVVTVSPM